MKFIRGLITKLLSKINSLEETVISQRKILLNLEEQLEPNLHNLEVIQEEKVQAEFLRRNSMSNNELRLDLEKQYGNTSWANKLIDKIISMRAGTRQRKKWRNKFSSIQPK